MLNRLLLLASAILICLEIISCEKDSDEPGTAANGVEIYLTLVPYWNDQNCDYGKLNFDTIELAEEPILLYRDIIKYDTLSHKITLGISHDSLKIGDAGVYGRMFIVTIDKQPIYCGFKWPEVSSIPCNWVFIEEPYKELDQLEDHEIVLSFGSDIYTDPRLDRRIINRLIRDNKIW